MVPADRDQQAQRFTPSQAAAPASDTAQRGRPPLPACPDGDDLDLMNGINSGDQGCFELLYDRYKALVFAVCLRILQNHMDAEEALIETFWQLWDRSSKYDESQGSVRGYLFMLARSRALDRRRARNAGVNTSHIEEVQKYGGGPPAPPDSENCPVTDTLHAERSRRTREAMETLTEEQREVVELAFFDGLSHTQIAEALSLPLGTVKTRIRQGLIRMRDALRTSYGGDAS